MVRVMAPRLAFDREVDRQRFLPGGRVEDSRDFGTKLAAFCKQINCPYLDLFPLLQRRAEVSARNLYFPTDEHFDLLGHELVAQEVFSWIKGPEPAASR
jgi:lysophospholipase L1-like esterase